MKGGHQGLGSGAERGQESLDHRNLMWDQRRLVLGVPPGPADFGGTCLQLPGPQTLPFPPPFQGRLVLRESTP